MPREKLPYIEPDDIVRHIDQMVVDTKGSCVDSYGKAILSSNRRNDARYRKIRDEGKYIGVEDTPLGQWLLKQNLLQRYHDHLRDSSHVQSALDIIWDRASIHFVMHAHGNVATRLVNADRHRIARTTEIAMLYWAPGVTHVNGQSKEKLFRMNVRGDKGEQRLHSYVSRRQMQNIRDQIKDNPDIALYDDYMRQLQEYMARRYADRPLLAKSRTANHYKVLTEDQQKELKKPVTSKANQNPDEGLRVLRQMHARNRAHQFGLKP